jgi:exosome complex RNA-binding protein Rrp42 (RNase PH superfamily)
LCTKRIPKVTINSEEINDYTISDDVQQAVPLDISRIPTFITLTRINSQYVADVTREEEAASISSIAFAVNQTEGIVYIKKFGSGSLHPEPIKDIFDVIFTFLFISNFMRL